MLDYSIGQLLTSMIFPSDIHTTLKDFLKDVKSQRLFNALPGEPQPSQVWIGLKLGKWATNATASWERICDIVHLDPYERVIDQARKARREPCELFEYEQVAGHIKEFRIKFNADRQAVEAEQLLDQQVAKE